VTRSAKKEKTRFTYGDYCTWPEDQRWEIIDGEAYDMTPAPSRYHSLISGELFKQLAVFFEGKPCEVHAAPFDVRLPLVDEPDEEVDTVVQPDLVVVCDDRKGCRGAPDIAIEILSPSTSSKDAILKRERYQRAGVKQYWLADPESREISILTLDEARAYRLTGTFGDADTITVAGFPGLVIDMGKVFARLPKTVRESPAKYL